ncbi:heme o synthase [Natronoglycomyces albus]|uniref:Protoheme IX farnesyltransferase n=1 Tax=Natronoglycomyces albus TaxID=2811108 RepID=A0A895XEV3_9ACTN|nr:heme o synthase [Natronoglycomyces albus]QSB03864.1 protoheme IX farnesyltransferase [Natronoglycomyces albus]
MSENLTASVAKAAEPVTALDLTQEQSQRAPSGPTSAPGAPLGGSRDVESDPEATSSLKARIAGYVSLTKPRIVELLLITTVPTMLLASRLTSDSLPSLGVVLVVLIGGAFAAGSANAINCYIDRDIDQLMKRTSSRPLPQHNIDPRNALIFGLVLGILAVGGLWVTVGWLAAALTLGAIAYYDLVYTLWLKRTTPSNTVWGGICGAAPVLIGWAAVTGTVSAEAWLLFAVVFFWQPPHFYALAIKFKDDYSAAGIPMLPSVATAKRVAVESVIFGWLMLVTSLLLWPLGSVTYLYVVVAAVTGGLFVLECHKLLGRALRGEDLKPMRLFHWSTSYLALLFLALAVDTFLI